MILKAFRGTAMLGYMRQMHPDMIKLQMDRQYIKERSKPLESRLLDAMSAAAKEFYADPNSGTKVNLTITTCPDIYFEIMALPRDYVHPDEAGRPVFVGATVIFDSNRADGFVVQASKP